MWHQNTLLHATTLRNIGPLKRWICVLWRTVCSFRGHNKENDKSCTSCSDKRKHSWNDCTLVAQQCPLCYASLGQSSLHAALIRLFRLAALQTHRAQPLSQEKTCFSFLLSKWSCKVRGMGWSQRTSSATWKTECTPWLVGDTVSRTACKHKWNHDCYQVKMRTPLGGACRL